MPTEGGLVSPPDIDQRHLDPCPLQVRAITSPSEHVTIFARREDTFFRSLFAGLQGICQTDGPPAFHVGPRNAAEDRAVFVLEGSVRAFAPSARPISVSSPT